jgi:hypothetical protein
MALVKISALPAITSGSLSFANDVVPIVGVGSSTTYKTTLNDLKGALGVRLFGDVNNVAYVTGSLNIEGTISTKYLARNTTYTATVDDSTIEVTSGTFTITLYTAVGNTGRNLIIKNGGTGVVTVDGDSTETIDGQATITIGPDETLILQSNGNNWISLNHAAGIIPFSHDWTTGTPADNTTYYIGNFTVSQPSTVQDLTRQVRATVSGWAKEIYLMVSVAGTLATSEDSTLVLRNVTTSTQTTITTTLEHNTASQQLTFTLATPLQITKGDLLELRWTTPNWGTNPAAVRQFGSIIVH